MLCKTEFYSKVHDCDVYRLGKRVGVCLTVYICMVFCFCFVLSRWLCPIYITLPTNTWKLNSLYTEHQHSGGLHAYPL